MPNEHPCTPQTLTEPADWWAAFRHAAEKAGVSLSEWLGAAGRAKLPADVRRQLSERPGAHRPRKEQP